jgi:hypothetical protein
MNIEFKYVSMYFKHEDFDFSHVCRSSLMHEVEDIWILHSVCKLISALRPTVEKQMEASQGPDLANLPE